MDSPRSRGLELQRDVGIEWLACPDGKTRPVKPGIRLLVNGFPGRVGALKAGGNAIHPEVGAEFVRAYEEAIR